MSSKNRRLLREYLYRKSQISKEIKKSHDKNRIRSAIYDGKRLPTELFHKESELRKEMLFDDDKHELVNLDDEYAFFGEKEPKILITTSRDPSTRLLQFVKELCLVFPNSERMNRGNRVISDLLDLARKYDVTDVVLCHETRGEPDNMIISHLPFGPTIHFALQSTVLRHDLEIKETVSQTHPHLIFSGFNETKLAKRVISILKHLFSPSSEKTAKTVSFVNDRDFITFRHHTYTKDRKTKEVSLDEMGPRFELRPYLITLGTAESKTADTEWALRSYTRTSKYKDYL